MDHSFSAKALFEISFKQAPIGIALIAPNGRWITVNQALCTMFGYSEQELLAKSLRVLTYPSDLHADGAKYSALLAGHLSQYQTEKRYFHKNGAIIWAALSISLVRKDCGSQDFYIYQFDDVTEKKRQEARQSIFFDHSTHLFAVVGPDGYLEQANAAWTRTLGWSSSELAEKRLVDLIHPEDRDHIAQPKRRAARYLAKDGSYHHIEWLTTVFQHGRFHLLARKFPTGHHKLRKTDGAS